jgi:cytoskeletal protein CcmA (bactofilin family)
MIGSKKAETGGGQVSMGAPGDVKAILGKGSEFEGKLRFEGTVRIDGNFKGEVHSAGTLIVGEHALIEGDMEVDSAVISGKVTGNVYAKSKVELLAPAKLKGNIQAPTLVIQEGVSFDGNCQMSKEGMKPLEKQSYPAAAEEKKQAV